MVFSHRDELVIPHPFQIVCQAFTLRYPNPFSPHVITTDTLVRDWDPETGILRSSRLVLKRGTLPTWAPRGIVEKSETWVVEESSINMLDGTMMLSNRNVDHRRVMDVHEQVMLSARVALFFETNRTKFTGIAQVTSSWGFYVIRKKIEQYGIERFRRQSKNSKHGLDLIIKLLKTNSPLREPLLNAEKIKYPSSLAPSSRLKLRLRELRLRAKEKQRLLSEMLRSGNKMETIQTPTSLDADPTHEDEHLTDEEEAELKQLEKEFSLDPSSVVQSSSSATHARPKSRWCWCWRWHWGTQSYQAKESNSCGNQPGSRPQE